MVIDTSAIQAVGQPELVITQPERKKIGYNFLDI